MSPLPLDSRNSPVNARVQASRSNNDDPGHYHFSSKLRATLLAFASIGIFHMLRFFYETALISQGSMGLIGAKYFQKEIDSDQFKTSDDRKMHARSTQSTMCRLRQEQLHHAQTAEEELETLLAAECAALKSFGGTSVDALMVWAYDEPPDIQRLQNSISSFPNETSVHLWCGSTVCMQRANRIRMMEHKICLQISRLNVQELSQDTPLSTWAEHHVLAKLLSGHYYEHHLQVAMQLAAVWKTGGVLLQPGVRYDAKKIGTSHVIGTCDGSIAQTPPAFGGLWGLFQPKESSVVYGMIEHFLHTFRWEKPIRQRYNPETWPVLVNLEGLLDAPSVTRSFRKACPNKNFVDGYGGPSKYYATLNYDLRHKYLIDVQKNYGMNLGDETQGLAGIQMLPRLDAFVERDDIEAVKFIDRSTASLFEGNASHPDDGRRVEIFFNAWWGTSSMTWPPPTYINPIMISMHIQPGISKVFQEIPPSSSLLPTNSTDQLSSEPPVAPYLKSQSPIGARDTKTLKFFRESGVQAFFSACMTMTLSLPNNERDNTVLIVDVDIDKQLKGVIPKSILRRSIFLTQKLMDDDADDSVLRFVLAFERLVQYSRARLVFTNRLHVAMPCVALKTPVVFVHGKTLPGGGGNRMDGLDVFMHQLKENETLPADFDWDDPPPNPMADAFKKQVSRIKQLSICHLGISESSRKFSLMPANWNVGLEDKVCTVESGWTQKPNAIHIATSIDANFFEQVFPSWIHAISKSNQNETLVIYILTVNLSEKQRCLLRLMALKLLPNAKIFTIPADVGYFEESYNAGKIRHVSVATQARLLLPSILPCVYRLVWIDLDAFIVGPIREVWNQPTGKCGIAARSSIVNFMSAYRKKYPMLASWNEVYGKSFNAGVMVVDLERLRETHFEANIVQYWAVELGTNDQVTFNLACNSSHTELNAKMNVFQHVSPSNTPNQSEWIIVHFQGSKKPWVEESIELSEFGSLWDDIKITFEQVLDM